MKTVKLLAISLAAFALGYNAYANTNNSDRMDKHNANNNQQHVWICETNASSANTDADKKVDEEMKMGKKSAKEAFDFAFKHCRDCTKITCSSENRN